MRTAFTAMGHFWYLNIVEPCRRWRSVNGVALVLSTGLEQAGIKCKLSVQIARWLYSTEQRINTCRQTGLIRGSVDLQLTNPSLLRRSISRLVCLSDLYHLKNGI